MSSDCSIYKDQPNLVLEVQWVDCFGTIINVAGAAVLLVRFVRPSGTTFDKIPVMPGGGVDGICRYTTVAADLNAAGNWKRWWYTDVTGWCGPFEFTVKDHP